MSMTPAEVERKVRQLDHDVQSIYDLLNGITTTQQRHTNRLGELAEQIGALEAKVDEKFAAVDVRFDSLEAKVDTILELLRAR
jgi:chromosome segregation ATPase